MRFSVAALVVLATVAQASARMRLLGFGSLGEVHYNSGYDMGGTTALPQVGVTVEYRTPLVAIYNTPSIGYYIGRPVMEDYLGMELGWDIGWARPALTGGIGVQTYYRQRFRWESDQFDREFQLRYPIGLGFRLHLFRTFHVEWQGRMWNRPERDGIPFWRLEIGIPVIP